MDSSPDWEAVRVELGRIGKEAEQSLRWMLIEMRRDFSRWAVEIRELGKEAAEVLEKSRQPRLEVVRDDEDSEQA